MELAGQEFAGGEQEFIRVAEGSACLLGIILLAVGKSGDAVGERLPDFGGESVGIVVALDHAQQRDQAGKVIFFVVRDRGGGGNNFLCVDPRPPSQGHLGDFGKEAIIQGNGVAEQFNLAFDICAVGCCPIVRPHNRQRNFPLVANALDVVLVRRRHQDQFVFPIGN